ncbi:hypothetical protein [Streptomyces sp. NPDC047070]|uniref:DUF7848 domain-containing protein n=1 Tax=Streptomyces sp. NPDC047070 TaxID=3154923 RepID=UPI003457024F
MTVVAPDRGGNPMTRAAYRFIPHSIRHQPMGGVIYDLACMACPETSGPQVDQDTAQLWALRHTGRHPEHNLYRRTITDIAQVTREG